MKKLIILFLLLSLSTFSFSQNGEAPLRKSSKQVDFGLGLDSSGLPLYGQMDFAVRDRKSTRLNSSHTDISRMPSSA